MPPTPLSIARNLIPKPNMNQEKSFSHESRVFEVKGGHRPTQWRTRRCRCWCVYRRGHSATGHGSQRGSIRKKDLLELGTPIKVVIVNIISPSVTSASNPHGPLASYYWYWQCTGNNWYLTRATGYRLRVKVVVATSVDTVATYLIYQK